MRTVGLWAIASLVPSLGGCGDWPRWQHVGDDTGAVPVTAVAEVSWPAAASEPAEPGDDQVATAPVVPISLSEPLFLASGTLDGTGWCSAADHPDECAPLTEQACGATLGAADGRYAHDVDVWPIQVDDGGTPSVLCARASVSASADGATTLFDLLVVPVASNCPGTPVMGETDPLGWSLEGAGGWDAPVASGEYAILVAGARLLTGADASTSFGYDLGLALIPAPADGGLVVCPALPGESSSPVATP